MRGLRARLRHGDDHGATLVELLMASVLLAVVLPLAGGLLHGAVSAQRDVGSVTQANTAAQAIASSVEAGVRNASALRLTASGLGGADELLVTRVRAGTFGSGSWACQAWFYSAADTTFYTRSTPVTATTTSVTAPTPATLSSWTHLGSGVVPQPAGRIFTVGSTQRQLDLAFMLGTGTDRAPVTISTSIVRRPQDQIKGTPCF